MKSLPVQTILFTVVAGSIVGGSVGYVGGQSLNKQNERQYKERIEARSNILSKTEAKEEDTNPNSNHIDDAVYWVNAMKSMPANQGRTDMANNTLKALEDNVITVDENKALSAQFDQLKNTNLNQRTKENAIKIREGEDIVDDLAQEEAIEAIDRKNREALYDGISAFFENNNY